jgi:dTMP kinase
MASETELLLVNASRAQLVREVIRPALMQGTLVLCDRFYDSTVAYQGYGRRLDLAQVRSVIELAVGDTRPNLTLLLRVPVAVGESRSRQRRTKTAVRDRMEEADREFFQRVEQGFDAVAAAEPERVKVVDATTDIGSVEASIWEHVSNWLARQ